MRLLILPAVLAGLLAGCSAVNIGPHRIDVQQGNALDQESIARLKPGLNRSQVRFLLGTPLIIDPFRNDRWDYVYVYYKAGRLAEQKRISLFFDGDTLVRMEGDVPASEQQPQPAARQSSPALDRPASPANAEAGLRPAAGLAPSPATAPQRASSPAGAGSAPATAASPAVSPAKPVAAPGPAAAPEPRRMSAPETSVVQPLASPKEAPPYVDPRTKGALSLQPETDVGQIKPDVMPPFPEPHAAATPTDDEVLKALRSWADAWSRRDDRAYFAAYDAGFVPQGGASRADWEKRRRQLIKAAKTIDVRIDSPSMRKDEEGVATVTFNQVSRSDSHREAVVKQLRMIERDGRWLIIEEKVLPALRGATP